MAGELTRLGEVLMQVSRDNMNISLANKADERNRERQLEDRAAAEQGEERRFQRGLSAQRTDTKLARDEAFQAAVLQALVQNGFLAPADVGNPDAVAAAYSQAQQSGLVARFEKLISQGLLKPDDVGDPAKVNEALAKLGESNVQMTGNAQAEATRLRDESIQVQMENEQLDAELQRPAEQPSDQQILSRAVQLAQQAKPGKTPSEEDIQSFAPQAAEELQQRALQDKMLRDQAAVQRKQLLQNRAMDLQRRQENLETRFRVAPGPVAPPTSAAPMTPAPAARQATAQERADALRAALRGDGGAPAEGPAAPGATPAFANTFNDPEISAYNERQQAAQLVNRVRPLQAARQSAEEKVRMAQANIDRLKANPASSGNAMNPAFPASVNQYGVPAPQTNQYGVGPSDNRVRELNRLYASLQEGQQELSAAEKQLAEYQNAAKRGTAPVAAKTTPFTDPVFAPPSQTPFDSRLQMQPAM